MFNMMLKGDGYIVFKNRLLCIGKKIIVGRPKK